jgi:hypothetical protein
MGKGSGRIPIGLGPTGPRNGEWARNACGGQVPAGMGACGGQVPAGMGKVRLAGGCPSRTALTACQASTSDR